MPNAPELQGFQRRHLRGKAHPLKPVVQVGDGGVSDAVVQAIDEALASHELIKVRLHAPDDKKGTAAALAERTSSALCGVVGHTVILYRPDPEEPRLELPTRAG
jgi:RNA-binding protein